MNLNAKDLVEKVTDFINTFSLGGKCDEFTEAMCREHRTLQQSFTRLCLAWLEKCASDDYRHDGRNEASHKLAKEMIEAWKATKTSKNDVRLKPSGFLPMV